MSKSPIKKLYFYGAFLEILILRSFSISQFVRLSVNNEKSTYFSFPMSFSAVATERRVTNRARDLIFIVWK